MSSSDPDNGQSFSYILEDDANGLFRIDNNQVKVDVDNRNCLQLGGARCRINYELQRSVNIRVRTEDSGNPRLSFTKGLTINISDINDRPRDIRLSSNILKENATKGSMIGQLTVTDEDIDQSITFRLTNDDNGRFALTGNSVLTKAKDTNYESSKTHRVTVEAKDNGNPPLKVCFWFNIKVVLPLRKYSCYCTAAIFFDFRPNLGWVHTAPLTNLSVFVDTCQQFTLLHFCTKIQTRIHVFVGSHCSQQRRQKYPFLWF